MASFPIQLTPAQSTFVLSHLAGADGGTAPDFQKISRSPFQPLQLPGANRSPGLRSSRSTSRDCSSNAATAAWRTAARRTNCHRRSDPLSPVSDLHPMEYHGMVRESAVALVYRA